MQNPLQIVFHGLDHSDAVEERVREKVAKLEQFYSGIIGCRVVIEVHHKNTANTHKRGEPFHVHVHVTVPGEELTSASAHGKNTELKAHEDVGIAIRDAFDSMERQLREYSNRKRDGVKVAAG